MADPAPADDPHRLTDIDQLEARYGPAMPRSLLKEIDHVNETYRQFIERSPFFALASVGPDGADCTPRGDRAPAVTVVDPTTIHLPDRPGNNRIDTLRNIVVDGRVALLFLVPGVTECLRVNGTANLSVAPELLSRYAVDGREPRSVIVVAVEAVYFQCARAIKRAQLWDPEGRHDPDGIPSAGRMLADARTGPEFDADAYDADMSVRLDANLY